MIIVNIHWTWSIKYRFQEVKELRFTIFDEELIKKAIALFIKDQCERYCYDCGHLDAPLSPYVQFIEIIRAEPLGQFNTEDWCQNSIFRGYEHEMQMRSKNGNG